MSGTDGPKGVAALNLMGLRLGEVAQGLREAAEKIAEASGREGLKTHIDVRVRSLGEALDGAAEGAGLRAARPVREPDAPKAEAREALLDSYDEADAYVVTVELPGVAADDIQVTVGDGRLIVETGGARRYRAEAPLPEGVGEFGLERRLANGILELRLPKQEGAR